MSLTTRDPELTPKGVPWVLTPVSLNTHLNGGWKVLINNEWVDVCPLATALCKSRPRLLWGTSPPDTWRCCSQYCFQRPELFITCLFSMVLCHGTGSFSEYCCLQWVLGHSFPQSSHISAHPSSRGIDDLLFWTIFLRKSVWQIALEDKDHVCFGSKVGQVCL